MTTMAVMPRATDDWTVDDLTQLPEDDGLRYELIDGTLIVSPAPNFTHQRVARRLTLLLEEACPPHLEVFFAPLDWQPDRRNSLEPDLLVVAKDDLGDGPITAPLRLAVEVLSPSSRLRDTKLKYAKYAEGGVASYWIVDPAEPSLVAYDLHDGQYVEVARGASHDAVTLNRPYPVTVTPSSLVSH
ncbi:Uma2 family endonuclease [Phytoactinopolyspora limicola]|uniref:Uma2 family endonuclease n=1 Tax=Phytoactinopolyspora limicola TaxID=2715536 RepID=UPI00140CBB71|nr:Uma2 family endonuclease [Phytoactinopolyspora limicola]